MIESLTRRLLALVVVAAVVPWAGLAHAAQDASKLTVLFTGDNGGKLAPCG